MSSALAFVALVKLQPCGQGHCHSPALAVFPVEHSGEAITKPGRVLLGLLQCRRQVDIFPALDFNVNPLYTRNIGGTPIRNGLSRLRRNIVFLQNADKL